MIFNHGTAAYYADSHDDCNKIVGNTIELAKGTHADWEICCSREDQYIGVMGFTCTGTATALYNQDCNSYVDQTTGKRVANHEEFKCDETGWYAATRLTEAFVKDVHIQEFWIRHDFYNEYLHAYQDMGEECGLPYRTVEEPENGEKHERMFDQRMFDLCGIGDPSQKFNEQMLIRYYEMFNKLFDMGIPIKVITPIENMFVDDDSPYVKDKCYPHHFFHYLQKCDQLRFIAESTSDFVDVDDLVANGYRR